MTDSTLYTAVVSIIIIFTSSSILVQARPRMPRSFVVQPWWHRPCENSDFDDTPCAKDPHSIRHFRWVRDLRKVILMATIAQNDIVEKTDIYSIIKDQIPSDQFLQSWLPQPLFKDFKKYLRANKSKNLKKHFHDRVLKKWLPQIHNDIQTYAITFESLRYVRIHSNLSTYEISLERRAFMEATVVRMRTLLCELEQSMNNSCLASTIERVTELSPLSPLVYPTSLTNTLIQDWSVIVTYTRCLNDWLRIFKKMRQKLKAVKHASQIRRRLRVDKDSFRDQQNNERLLVRQKKKRPWFKVRHRKNLV